MPLSDQAPASDSVDTPTRRVNYQQHPALWSGWAGLGTNHRACKTESSVGVHRRFEFCALASRMCQLANLRPALGFVGCSFRVLSVAFSRREYTPGSQSATQCQSHWQAPALDSVDTPARRVDYKQYPARWSGWGAIAGHAHAARRGSHVRIKRRVPLSGSSSLKSTSLGPAGLSETRSTIPLACRRPAELQAPRDQAAESSPAEWQVPCWMPATRHDDAKGARSQGRPGPLRKVYWASGSEMRTNSAN